MVKKSLANKPVIWITATLISLGLLTLVVMQVDWSETKDMLMNVSWWALAAALTFLLCEGIITALRLWLFAGRKPCLSEGLKANAWYVLLLVVLPARLGEVAAVWVFGHYLGQKRGAAVMSIIAQRLYDVVVLGTFFLLALMGLKTAIDTHLMVPIAGGLIFLSVVFLFQLERALTLAARIFLRWKFRHGVLRKILRLVLQGRIYVRHNMSRTDIPLALLFTIGKWMCNLGALASLLIALNMGLSFYQEITIGAAYNFLAAVPLQTVGGIGVGEAGLTLFLKAMGIATSTAAGAALMVRFVILAFPFIFWVLVMGGLRMKEKIWR